MLADLGAEPVVADAMDADALMRAVRAARPDAVVNMITRIRPSPRAVAACAPRTSCASAACATCSTPPSAAGARRFVSESFFGVYGFGPYERPRTEDDPIGRERNRGVQAVIDAIASSEGQVRAASAEERIEGVSLRFAAFHGPLAPNTATMVELARKRRLPIIGAHGATMPLVELADAARAVADALEHAPAGRSHTLPTTSRWPWRTTSTELTRVIGAPPPRHVPYWLVRLAGPYVAGFMGRARVPLSTALIAEELGWRPRYPTYREALGLLADDERDLVGAGVGPLQRA